MCLYFTIALKFEFTVLWFVFIHIICYIEFYRSSKTLLTKVCKYERIYVIYENNFRPSPSNSNILIVNILKFQFFLSLKRKFSDSTIHVFLTTKKTLWQIVIVILDFNLSFRGKKKNSCLDWTSLRRRKTESTIISIQLMGLIVKMLTMIIM